MPVKSAEPEGGSNPPYPELDGALRTTRTVAPSKSEAMIEFVTAN